MYSHAARLRPHLVEHGPDHGQDDAGRLDAQLALRVVRGNRLVGGNAVDVRPHRVQVKLHEK